MSAVTPDQILSCTTHRPWPLPQRPWILRQDWHDLLFAHWPVAADILRRLVPAELPLDTYQSEGWVGIVPFHMSGVGARGLRRLASLAPFPELNVRTYVKLDDKPGVYFFSLDAGNRKAVWAARRFYHLPYFLACMKAEVSGDTVAYTSRRLEGDAEFRARYRPAGPVQPRAPGSLETWLTERYCLYVVSRGQIYRGDIHHQAWPLQDAEAEILTNTMASAAHIVLPPRAPLVHFSKRQSVLIWPLECRR